MFIFFRLLSIVLHIAENHIVTYPKFWDFKGLLCEGKTKCFPLTIFYTDQGLVSDLTKQAILIPFILQPFERSIVPLSATCSLFVARYNKFDFSEKLAKEMLYNMFRPKGSCIPVGWTVTLHTLWILDFQISSIFPWREGLGYAKYLIVIFRIMDSHVLLVLHK